jgi:hypothetical protein
MQPTNLVDLLGRLHDIAEPPPVPMTPQTWGWAVAALLLLAALGTALVAFLRYRRATVWRRAALAELQALAPALRAGDPDALARLETLLRRVALATAPRPDTAPLTGAAWTGYLATTGGGFGDLPLADAPYRLVAGYDGAAALAAARRWIGARHA